MRVALDGQLTVGTATGIGEYTRGLAAALPKQHVDVRLLRWPPLDPWRFDRRVFWDQVGLPLRAAAARADILHCTSGTMPLFCPAPVVVTVHDVAWLRVQTHARPYARAYFGAFALSRYRHAQRIIVDSAFSRDELVALSGISPGVISVVYPGVDADIMRVERRPDDTPFVLAVGTVERRKNLGVVIRALASVPRLRLISVGPATPYLQECAQLARDAGVEERVEFRGYVSRAELLDLYARAAGAVVPSTYEGFGYAVAQALCAGLPVVAAAAASLPEVAGGAATLVDPLDEEGWAVALRRFVADASVNEEAARGTRALALARFSWDRAAAATADVYRSALR
ncbi:MAG TPA: glycosyltransferase family 1 protein [Candidatus Baltobacteraceae bacterium]